MKKHILTFILPILFSQVNAQSILCGETFTDERDGQEYATVLVGEQCWMAENLNIGAMINQNGNNDQVDNSVIEKYCYNNDENECNGYGGLYQWNEMMAYQTGESIQGICPEGLHLPSDVEWMQMEMFLGMSEEDANQTGFERGTDEGFQLQVDGGTGFDALFGGIWYPDYGFVYNEDYPSPNGYYYAYFWSTTHGTYNNHYMYRNVNTQFETVTRWQAEWNFGYSVRCIADEYVTNYNFEFNGTNYEIVLDMKTWEDAAADAVEKGGNLVEINSLEEQEAIYDAIVNGAGIPEDYTIVNDGGGIAYVWIGATDKAIEGTWLWDGNNDNGGINYWTGQGANGSGNGQVIGGAYNNWGGTNTGTVNEPDDFMSNQDAGAIALSGWPSGTTLLGIEGEWNDINLTNQLYYIIEYSNSTDIKLKKPQNISIYPNPVQDIICFSKKDNQEITSVELIDISGKKIYQEGNKNFTRFSLDIGMVPKGIYIIKIYGEDNKLLKSEKIIKQ
ncbi:MAG: hypothetical protein DRJ05_08365 [Bacteroidetes bacterium]|nr:MAG: hypothetical protein DRJ05_08365 [Bacteroidota bacterium]